MWMKWFLVISLVGFSIADSSECPPMCSCSATGDGLSLKCSDIRSLFKYSLKNEQFDAHSLDLSNANIFKIENNFDRFDNLASLNLSSNHIEHVNKFLRNCTYMKQLKLSHNKLKKVSSSDLPQSIEVLDISDNYLKSVPSDLEAIKNLKFLDLSGNPIKCDCEGLKSLHSLRDRGVIVSDFKCFTHEDNKMRLWMEYKPDEECKTENLNNLDMMMGDQPSDEDEKKSVVSELNEGQVWEARNDNENDDDKQFLGIKTENTLEDLVEGSGDVSGIDLLSSTQEPSLARMIDAHTEEPEGSGDDTDSHLSSVLPDFMDYYDGSGDEDLENMTTTSTTTESFITGQFNPFFMPGIFDQNTTTEEPYEEPPKPTLFQGVIDWNAEPVDVPSSSTTETPIFEEPIVKVVAKPNENIVSTHEPSIINADLKEEETKQPLKTSKGTIVCIAIILILLVGLIVVALIKGQMRKSRDRRILRQEKVDAEKGDKEMVEMNKSLLGKPAPTPTIIESDKKKNGNYELVPLHDNKKPPNGNLGSNGKVNGTGSPPPKKNGSANLLQDTPDSANAIPKVEEPSTNAADEPLPSKPLSNGDTNPESSHLALPPEYVPVYGPESERVKIKMTEIAKPKTPVLITRTKSNAGDIVISYQ